MNNPSSEWRMASPILGTLVAASLAISVYHLVTHEAPLLPSILGQWSLLVASLALGVLGWHCLRQVTAVRQKNMIALYTVTLYVLAGLASLGYSFHQYLSPEVGMPIEGLIFESLFVALLVGMSGSVVGLEAARREGALRTLEAERDRFSQLFENIPEPAAEYEIDDGEITLTRGNDPFVEQFGVEPPMSITTFNDVAAGLASEAEPAELDRTLLERGRVATEVVRETVSGRRWFELRSATHPRGGFVLYFDITETHLREQQVRVLSRVLRHNLQNNLTVARGYARMIEQRADREELETNAEKICAAVEELLEIAERTETVRDHLEENPPKPEWTEITSIVEERVSTARDSYPDVEFAVDRPDEIWAEAHPTLGLVLAVLFEKLVEYNDHPEPAVSVTVEARTEDGTTSVVIRITDNGDGLPDQELIPIRTSEEPSQLEHATGVDLWMANWFIDQFGGVLDAETSAAGTTFDITLEAAAAEEPTSEQKPNDAD